jgi:hypothetical protein
MTNVKFDIGGTVIDAELGDSETARKIAAALPIETAGNYWGEEFYFSIPVKATPDETAREVVEPGTVAFWVQGSCLCLFWGPTPASHDKECRAASDVNVVGRVTNPEALKKLSGRKVRVTTA